MADRVKRNLSTRNLSTIVFYDCAEQKPLTDHEPIRLIHSTCVVT